MSWKRAEDVRDECLDLVRMTSAKHKDLLDLAQAQTFQGPREERCRAQREKESRLVAAKDFEAAIV